MQYELSYDEVLGIVEITIRGDIVFADIQATAEAAARLAKEKGSHLWLSDCRQARLKMNAFQLHDVPGMVPGALAASGLDAYDLRRAVVAQQDLEDYKFLETVAVNQGQRMKLFTDMDEARRWLLGTGADDAPATD